MRRTVPPSAEIENRIDELLAAGVAAGDVEGPLSELAQLGAKLIIQRAVEDEFDVFIGRARYERKPDAAPGSATAGARGGCRPRRGSSRWGCRSCARRPSRSARSCFRAASGCCAPSRFGRWWWARFVRGLSMRDVESLCEDGPTP